MPHRLKASITGLALSALVAVTLTGCFGPRSGDVGDGQTVPGTDEPTTISIWRTFEDAEVFGPIIDEFEQDNPDIDIEYKELPFDEFELVVSEALAAGEGPDIWSIRNDWIPRHRNKLVPMPEGLLAADTKTDEQRLGELFAPIVSRDVIADGRIYGLPYYVDTLAIWKNKAVFSAKIRELERADRDEDADLLRSPINTYDKLQRAVELLTERDAAGNILVSGLAAGVASNTTRAEDVVYAMMLQNGTEMVSPQRTNASFHLGVKNATGQTVFPGTEALTRYTSFADSEQSYYSWNAQLPGDIQMFLDGKAAMIFGFDYFEIIFGQIAPTLQFESAPLPQVRDTDTPVDYASYYVEAVTKNAKNPELAWRVLENLVIRRGESYRSATKRPDPRPETETPSVIDRGDITKDPFKYQQQTATNWYKTKRSDKVDTIFRDLIERVGTKSQAPQNAIEETAQRVSDILQKESS